MAPPSKRQCKPAAKPHRRAQAKKGPKPQKKPSRASVGLLDASIPSHLPGPRSCASYTVVRDRLDVPLQTGASDQVAVIGGYMSRQSGTNQDHMSSVVFISGAGADIPGTTETLTSSTFMAGAATGSYDVSLHALSVEVLCDGTSGGQVPNGAIYVGVPEMGIERTSYATWAAMATAFKTKKGMSRFTAYEVMNRPQKIVTYPLDAVAFSSFCPITSVANSSCFHGRALCPIVVILPANLNLVDFTFRVHLHWRLRANTDALLQSTQTTHTPAPEQLWATLTNGLSAVGGLVSQAPAAYAAAQQGYDTMNLIGATMNKLSRAAPLMLEM